MSTSVPPRDGGATTASSSPVSSVLGDELALRRVFDLEYSALITSARSQLGEAESHAPRIVECAFVDAWKQRATLASNEQLKSFLADQVHHGASRALSRRAAAHRFGSHGGRDDVQTSRTAATAIADAERSWGEVTKAIHDSGPSKDAHAAVATAGRHEAAEHMKSVAKGRSWKLPVAFGLVVVAAAVGAMFYLDNLGEGEAAVSAVSSGAMQPTAASTSGQIGSLTLADGSKMRIGPDTKVFVADGFPTKLRALRIEGTAQFDVAPNQPLPFYVVIRKAQVVATGTSFVVNAYPADSTSFGVLVKEGSVTVKSGKLSTVLTANQSAVIRGNTSETPTDAQRAEAFGWVDGQISMTDKPLRDVLAGLGRWFNLDIKVPDLPLLDRKASFAVTLDSSRAAIAQVEKSANVKFGFEGESRVFRDATAAPKKK